MGFGKMGYWDNDNTFFDKEVKSINKWKNTFQSPIPLKTGSSTFQYSMREAKSPSPSPALAG
jgi:hypothetical protein